jgi:methyl-accepting chemotaxis protein
MLFLITIAIVQANLYYQIMKMALQDPQLTGFSVLVSKINVVFVGWFLIGGILIVAGGMFISHRIVGPLKRLERQLLTVGEGHIYSEMKTRKGDEFKEINLAYNQMILGLRTLLLDEKRVVKEVHDNLQQLLIMSRQELSTPEKRTEFEKQFGQLIKKEERLLSSLKVDNEHWH